MKIVLIVQQTFNIDAATLFQAHDRLREGHFPSGEMLLAVKDELGNDITEQWLRCADETE